MSYNIVQLTLDESGSNIASSGWSRIGSRNNVSHMKKTRFDDGRNAIG
jgi:hypothetical protein